MFRLFTIVTFFALLILQISASPASLPNGNAIDLERRTDPHFPDSPASCPICQKVSCQLQVLDVFVRRRHLAALRGFFPLPGLWGVVLVCSQEGRIALNGI
jgi:hypothetical protein